MADEDNLLRLIPPVDLILNQPWIQETIAHTSREFVQKQINQLLSRLREDLRSNNEVRITTASRQIANLEMAFCEQIAQTLAPRLKRVVNATGVILHTNLGRAPLAEEAAHRVTGILASYSNLEMDLETGRRGHRDEHVEPALCSLLGCEAATAVNNNAAAIFLVLNELASGGEVIVSRGELIEIGGSFRIPEILSRSHATLREVGTTNKTRLTDYAAAFNENTRLLLKVHPSNYRVIGFTEATPLAELAKLAHTHGVPLVEDAGSGLLEDLSAYQITREPLPSRSLAAGVDLITFSVDKLLGGPQAGIIAGRRDLIQRVRKNPLMRILRLDKITLTALEATLSLYLRGQAATQIPVLRMIREKPEILRRRALNLKRRLRRSAGSHCNFELVKLHSAIGGGSCPDLHLASWGLAVSSSAESAVDVERRMRVFDPPIIARIEQDRLLLDMRTLLADDEIIIARFFTAEMLPR